MVTITGNAELCLNGVNFGDCKYNTDDDGILHVYAPGLAGRAEELTAFIKKYCVSE